MSDDERLRALLHDAVSDVQPRDGLSEIRRRTRRTATSRGRHWWPVALGAGIATAAVVGGVVLTVGLAGEDSPQRDRVAGSPSGSGTPTQATAVYFLGDTPTGPRLYREFQRLPAAEGEARAEVALSRLSGPATADDPDYRSSWPAASFGEVVVEDQRVVVEVTSPQAIRPPAGTPEEQRLGVQQVVYTVEAAIGETLPVAFVHEGRPATRVLGQEVGELVQRDRQYDVTAPVNISDPVEGEVVVDAFTATGSAADTVSEVQWQVRRPDRPQGSAALLSGGAPVGGPGSGTLGAPGWTVDVAVDDLPPGSYLFVVETVSTGQTSDASTTFTDTRTIQVR